MADGGHDTLPPHDIAAERAVLGAILLRPDCVDEVREIVVPADFYSPSHGVIAASMFALADAGQPIDVVTLTGHLRDVAHSANISGGPQYLGDLTDCTSTSAHVEAHARKVAALARVRRVIAAGHAISSSGFKDGPADVDGFCNQAANTILAATEAKSRTEPIELAKAIDLVFDNIERTLARGSRIAGIASGIPDLDALTAGFQPGQLIIDAARPKVGKTSFATHQIVECARAGGRVLCFSVEMPRSEIAARMLCQQAGVDFNRVRTNSLTQDDFDAINKHAAELYDLPIWIDDDTETSLATVRSKARKYAREGLALIVVDYLQIMNTSEAETRARELALITTGLKKLAKELSVPVLLLSQLNRAVENRGAAARPKLSDLRESGAIEQDADLVLMLHRPEMHDRETEDKGVAEIIIAAQRNGPTGGIVRVGFDAATTRFTPLAADDARRNPPAEENGRRRRRRSAYGNPREYGQSNDT